MVSGFVGLVSTCCLYLTILAGSNPAKADRIFQVEDILSILPSEVK
jgi:hypothetical protein